MQPLVKSFLLGLLLFAGTLLPASAFACVECFPFPHRDAGKPIAAHTCSTDACGNTTLERLMSITVAAVQCKYCGRSAGSEKLLSSLGPCAQSPSKKHVPLRGPAERKTYVCRYCGAKAQTVRALTAGYCNSNPKGKRHVTSN